MKKLITIFMLIFTFSACAKSPTVPEYKGERVEVNFTYNKRPGFSINQFVAWIEDENGNYINTVFATKKTTKDGLWKKREESLSNWRKKINISLTSSEKIDAFSGATPNAKKNTLKYAWFITNSDGTRVPNGKYILCVEGTIYKSHNVVYKGEINIGGDKIKVNLVPVYSSEEAKTSDMIENVYAEYFKN